MSISRQIFLSVILTVLVQVLCRIYHKKNPSLEDDFVGHFGNNSTDMRWDWARNLLERGEETLLKNFCAEAHKMAKKGPAVVNSVMIRPRILVFKNEKYVRRRVDLLAYGLSGVTHPKYDETYWYMAEGEHGYITQGKSPDCVYYLSLLNCFTMKFALVKYVCGIHINLNATKV